MSYKQAVTGLLFLVILVPGLSSQATFALNFQYHSSQSSSPNLTLDALLQAVGDDQVDQESVGPTGMSRDEALQKLLSTEESPPVVGEPQVRSDIDLGLVLPDTKSDYRKLWEPWQTKAALRSMIASPDKEFILMGGGYLHDNTIKVYRYNTLTNQYDHVWDSGDGVINGDVVSLGWGDTDNNKFPEAVAGSADGHVYAFEQVHIHDPKTNTENRFDLVWKSPLLQQVWGLAVADTDLDFLPDIVAGSWDGAIHWFEYTEHSGYPFTQEHWIDYKEKYVAKLPGEERITALATADTNHNGLPEVIVGTWDGNVFIYENNGTVLMKDGVPFPLTQDNSYKLIYQNKLQFWNPITEIAVGNLDGDSQKELAFLVPGQGVFTFDYDSGVSDYFFNKVVKSPPTWELGTNPVLNDASAGYPVNTYVDWMVEGHNVLAYGNNTGAGLQPEPILEVRPAYPYNTSMAQPPNGDYSWFMPGDVGENATAIVDFGFTQEVTGDGRVSDGQSLKGYDLQFIMPSSSVPKVNQWQVSLSADLQKWTEVRTDEITTACDTNCYMHIDTDPALNRKQMLSYRYVKMTFFAPGVQLVDSVNSTTLARSLTEATALTLGSIDVSYRSVLTRANEPDKVIAGTSDGKLFVFEYDEVGGQVRLLWESYTEDLFTLGTNIWDIIQVQNSGKFPTWVGKIGGNETLDLGWMPPSWGGYSSHTHAHIFAPEIVSPIFGTRSYDDMVVTTKSGLSYIVPSTTNNVSTSLTTAFFTYVNYFYYMGIGPGGYHSTFADVYGDDGFDETLIMGYWDENPADPGNDTVANARLDVWLSGAYHTSEMFYKGPIDLRLLDSTGMLGKALEKSQAQPSAVMNDLDGDGDLDIVFTNGRVYVLWNLKDQMVWRFDSNYFEEINNNLRGRLYYNPKIVDFDGDGDGDLVVSYSLTGEKPRYGATYYENKGRADKPVWEQDKWLFINPDPSANLAYNNHTNIEFLWDHETGKVLNMTTYGAKQNAIVGFPADYTNHDHLMLATYPLVRRVEINLRDSEFQKNFGYRVFETWNTQPELAEWTQSIQFSDMDEDGKGELVVGDYDNNIYVFEYLTSGINGSVVTYKRAFRSPDLTQTDQMDESPYAADQLAGLSGTFNRTLWQHAKYVIAGLDLNGNGRQEVAVSTGLSLFLFEYTGRVDTYDIIWHKDLRFSSYGEQLDQLTEITALSGGLDIDYNGRGELLVAAGPYFFIFEYDPATGGFREMFGGDPDILGRYTLPGNPLFQEYMEDEALLGLEIQALAVGNIDGNEYQDIVVGGVINQPWGRQDGFLMILEHRIGTIKPIYYFNAHYLRELPITDLEFADQDYDGLAELLVGHVKGVDVWEYAVSSKGGDVVLQRLTHITSSMNHPIIPVKKIIATDPFYPAEVDKTPYGIRDHDLLSVRYKVGVFDAGDLVEVVVVLNRLAALYSKDDGDTWVPFGFLTPKSAYEYISYEGYSVIGDYQPTIVQHPDGRIIVGFCTSFYDKPNILNVIFTTEYTGGEAFGELVRVREALTTYYGDDSPVFSSPSLYLNPFHDGKVSMTYITNDTIVEYQHRSESNPWGDTDRADGNLTAINRYDLNGTYAVYSQDVTYHRPTSGFVIAFSGLKYDEMKPDRDIFVAYANNDTLAFNLTSRVTTASTDDLYPSISTLDDEHDFSVILAYEEQGISPGGRVMVSHSENLGITWNPPEPLPTQSQFMVHYCFEDLGCFMFYISPKTEEAKLKAIDTLSHSYNALIQRQQSTIGMQVSTNQFVSSEYDFYWVASIEAFSPAIAGRVDGGFAFTYSSNIHFGRFSDFLLAAKNALAQSVSQPGTNQIASSVSAGMTTASSDRVTSSNVALGKITSLMSGVNPSSLFARFSNGKTYDVAVGDSDGDARQEVFIASDRGVFLAEVQQTQENSRLYSEIWRKIDYPHAIHSVAMGDSNGNGFDELFVAGAEGNVYSYELVDLENPTTDLSFLTDVWEHQTNLVPGISPDVRLGSIVDSEDINDDGYKDLFYSTMDKADQIISAVDGETGKELWSLSLADEGYEGLVTDLDIVDLTLEGNFVVLVSTDHGYVLAIDAHGGGIDWVYVDDKALIVELEVGHFTSLKWLDIIVLYELKAVIVDYEGGLSSTIDTSTHLEPLTDSVGINMEPNDGLDYLLVVDEIGQAAVYSPDNSLVKTFTDTKYGPRELLNGGVVDTYDSNSDGFDEFFIAANGMIFSYDLDGERLWNFTDLLFRPAIHSLTTVETETTGKVIVSAQPTVIDFDSYSDGLGVYDNYADLGVIFGDGWSFYDQSIGGMNKTLYPTNSGDYYALSNGMSDLAIEFNQSQQYIAFYLNHYAEYPPPSTHDLQIIGLDNSGRTVFVTDLIGNSTNRLVQIRVDKPVVSRLVFRGSDGFADGCLTIDDFVVGGTTLLGFDSITGALEWRNEFFPTHDLIITPSSTGELLLGYQMHEAWLTNLSTHHGAVALDVESGRVLWTMNGERVHEVASIKSGFVGMLFEDSSLRSYAIITHPYYSSLYYEPQMTALWQVDTNQKFSSILKANLDMDSSHEFILSNGFDLIAAMDGDGRFLWKFRTATRIVDVVTGHFTSTTTEDVVLLTSDSRVFVLDPTTGLPQKEGGQYVTNYDPLDALVLDVTGDNNHDLVLGTTKPGSTSKGRVEVFTFNPNTLEFSLEWSRTLPGQVRMVSQATLDSDAKANDLLVLVLRKGVYALSEAGTALGSILGNVLKMTPGDFDGDQITDVAFIEKGNIVDVELFTPGSGFSQAFAMVGPEASVHSYGQIIASDLTGQGKDLLIYQNAGWGVDVYEMAPFDHLAHWEDPAIHGRILTTFDADQDGHQDLVLRNDNLVYALDMVGMTLQTIWSFPLSNYRFVTATTASLDGDRVAELVVLNAAGQVFALSGIPSPEVMTNPTPFIPTTVHSHGDWNVLEWSEELSNNVLDLDEPQKKLELYIFGVGLVLGLLPLIYQVIQLRKRKSKLQTNGGAN